MGDNESRRASSDNFVVSPQSLNCPGVGDDIRLVSMGWQRTLIDRLTAGVNPTGAWGYRRTTSPCAEPTAMVCLALAAREVEPDRWAPGLAWLAQLQRQDGGVPVSAQVSSPCWATGLALLAWAVADPGSNKQHQLHIERGTSWLLATRGRRLPFRPDVHGHDRRLQGWPWVDGTHSWLEPTAYAILALRMVGKNNHARTREGVKLLWDRALPGGGWNYGNKRVLGNTLRPFPETTGIALAALAGEPNEPQIGASIDYLTRELPRVHSPLTLGWGLIGLSAWDARPTEAQEWLERSALFNPQRPPNPLEAALLLMADSDPSPLIRTAEGKIHG